MNEKKNSFLKKKMYIYNRKFYFVYIERTTYSRDAFVSERLSILKTLTYTSDMFAVQMVEQ